MRVLILGAGGMGGYAARTAAGFDFIDKLQIGDLDLAAAEHLAQGLGNHAEAIRADVTAEDSMVEVLRGVDVVLNTVGPFFRLGPPVLRAAIRANCHYLDINDDWESTEAMMALASQAREAGITAVIGIGASPGISNLLALLAARELDSVEEIVAGFDLDAAMPETRNETPAAATIHGLHQLTGKIRLFERGRLVDQPPLRKISLEYPGLGTFDSWTMGHPEAITFPQCFPALKRCRVVMTMARENVLAMRLVAPLINTGLLSLERAARWLEWLEGVGKPVKGPEDYIAEIVGNETPRLPPLFAIARGEKNGQSASVAGTLLSAPASGMGGATGVPLAMGLAAVRPEGEARRGVFAAEAIIDPTRFFDELAPRCSPAKTNCGDLVLLSRSWENRDLRAELARL